MKHPVAAMIFGLFTSDGKKMNPVFFPSSLKTTADVYLDLFKKKGSALGDVQL